MAFELRGSSSVAKHQSSSASVEFAGGGLIVRKVKNTGKSPELMYRVRYVCLRILDKTAKARRNSDLCRALSTEPLAQITCRKSLTRIGTGCNRYPEELQIRVRRNV